MLTEEFGALARKVPFEEFLKFRYMGLVCVLAFGWRPGLTRMRLS